MWVVVYVLIFYYCPLNPGLEGMAIRFAMPQAIAFLQDAVRTLVL